MWLATSHGFYKIQQPEPGCFCICARGREDLLNLLHLVGGSHPVEEGDDLENCRYRIRVNQRELVSLMAALALSLDQQTLAGATAEHSARLEAFHRIWSALAILQDSGNPPETP